jgi:hypothetical protein
MTAYFRTFEEAEAFASRVPGGIIARDSVTGGWMVIY